MYLSSASDIKCTWSSVDRNRLILPKRLLGPFASHLLPRSRQLYTCFANQSCLILWYLPQVFITWTSADRNWLILPRRLLGPIASSVTMGWVGMIQTLSCTCLNCTGNFLPADWLATFVAPFVARSGQDAWLCQPDFPKYYHQPAATNAPGTAADRNWHILQSRLLGIIDCLCYPFVAKQWWRCMLLTRVALLCNFTDVAITV